MTCGCKKKKKPVANFQPNPVNDIPQNVLNAVAPAATTVQARCVNCVGLLRTDDGRYIAANTGEFATVTEQDVRRWRSQGWFIEVQQ